MTHTAATDEDPGGNTGHAACGVHRTRGTHATRANHSNRANNGTRAPHGATRSAPRRRPRSHA